MKLLTLAEKYNYTCYWCKKKWALEDLSRDHITPQNNRMHSVNSGKCVLSCICCNGLRGNKPFEQFQYEIKNKITFIND